MFASIALSDLPPNPTEPLLPNKSPSYLYVK